MRLHVVITGASSGIGAALARHYARSGHRLTLFGRNRDRLDAVASACGSAGAFVRTAVCDVVDADEMARHLEAADAHARVDLVVANAALGGEAVLASSSTESCALARHVIAVNTLGVINTVVPLIGVFAARRSGHVVIISSMAAFEGLPDAPAYSASKAAVRAYGHALRRLMHPHGVNVTVVCPGFVRTPMSDSLPFPKPFCWTVERAAERIARGIARREAEVVFPWQLRAAAAVSALLPRSWVDALVTSTWLKAWPKPTEVK